MGRQHMATSGDLVSLSPEQDRAEWPVPADRMLLQAAARVPGEFVAGLSRIDPQARVRAVQRLQAGIGNVAMGQLLAPRRAAETVVQRDDGDVADQGAQALDSSGGGGGASEAIGPPVSSTYTVSASSLADVLASIGGRSEAGYVGWVENMSSAANTGPNIDTVNVSVGITLEMPSWTPPSTMLPKAKAEWTRWYAALAAHEQGHIKLVHDVHDGIAAKILGKPLASGQKMFNAAKASLQAKTKAYDTANGNGTKAGTILDVGIEQLELDEEQKKKDAAAKAKSRDSAVPDVPEDE